MENKLNPKGHLLSVSCGSLRFVQRKHKAYPGSVGKCHDHLEMSCMPSGGMALGGC